MKHDFNSKRELLIAFTNGSYKKVVSVKYDHKEWIIIEKESGKKVFVNTANVKWIEEV